MLSLWRCECGSFHGVEVRRQNIERGKSEATTHQAHQFTSQFIPTIFHKNISLRIYHHLCLPCSCHQSHDLRTLSAVIYDLEAPVMPCTPRDINFQPSVDNITRGTSQCQSSQHDHLTCSWDKYWLICEGHCAVDPVHRQLLPLFPSARHKYVTFSMERRLYGWL